MTISNLLNMEENLSAADSRIHDADIAEESARLSRAQILEQAGTSVLAQAEPTATICALFDWLSAFLGHLNKIRFPHTTIGARGPFASSCPTWLFYVRSNLSLGGFGA